ncbi:carbohydrate-binding protein [Vallitalea guaymasensis]|uniref:carbohydrate-binding protein n=1 Tax=Vallitalea guaymasensis TaxID=1185412 RepID=UPI0023561CF6|nr:carbohydrate-binding protein [Vallitalea guaymasensis]
MKKTVKLLMSISLCMCMIMTLFTFNIYAAADCNVKLNYADAKQERDCGVLKGWYTQGEISVKDLGDNKNVVVHYTTDGSTWEDVTATFLKTATDGYDIYTFKTPLCPWNGFYYYNYNCQFAIKYEVNGQTYWDNNNGQDYSVNDSNM